jgi:S1-C subfamily serine protease
MPIMRKAPVARNPLHFLAAFTYFFGACSLLSFLAVGAAFAIKPSQTQVSSVAQILILDKAQNLLYSGSGTIIDNEGHILTNEHVIDPLLQNPENYTTLCLTDDPKKPPACSVLYELVSSSKDMDLALLKITKVLDKDRVLLSFDEFKKKYHVTFAYVPIDRAVTDESVGIGDEIQVLGYPSAGGASITATQGTVSGFQRSHATDGNFDPWLVKTDAKLNPGNSGGAAFDASGRFVGVPMAVSSAGNIGYLISLPVVNQFLDASLGKTASAPQTVGDASAQPAPRACPKGSAWNLNASACTCPEGHRFNDGQTECLTYDAYCVAKNGLAWKWDSTNARCITAVIQQTASVKATSLTPTAPKAYVGEPRNATDLKNCAVVADKTTKKYYVKGSAAIKTMSYKGKICYPDEASVKAARYVKGK